VALKCNQIHVKSVEKHKLYNNNNNKKNFFAVDEEKQ